MSRVGKQNITIPDKTTLTLKDGTLLVKGPKGELSRHFKANVDIIIGDKAVTLAPLRKDLATMALWGTYASHVENMIDGVNKPFVKKLIIEGIGFKADVQTNKLNMALGFSHPVIVTIPTGLTVTHEKGTLTITGIDKDLVGQFSAEIRSLKKPEPYKGKGIRYETEVIRRKQGKKSV